MQRIDLMIKQIDLSITVKFRESYYILKDVLDLCQPGESIENVPFESMNSLLYFFREKEIKNIFIAQTEDMGIGDLFYLKKINNFNCYIQNFLLLSKQKYSLQLSHLDTQLSHICLL